MFFLLINLFKKNVSIISLLINLKWQPSPSWSGPVKKEPVISNLINRKTAHRISFDKPRMCPPFCFWRIQKVSTTSVLTKFRSYGIHIICCVVLKPMLLIKFIFCIVLNYSLCGWRDVKTQLCLSHSKSRKWLREESTISGLKNTHHLPPDKDW